MARVSGQKLKLLYLYQLFFEKSDEAHPLSMEQILAYLHSQGISAERKAVYDDIELLRTFGLDILFTRGRTCGYYLAARPFELAELKLLADSIQSSRFLTEKKTRALIGKVEKLASCYQAEQLQRQVYVAGRVKTMNESVYYNVDALHAAIAADRQVSFHYCKYTVTRQRQLRRNGSRYVVSPFALVQDGERYYLLAYAESSGMIRHYRVDRMLDIELTAEKRLGQDMFQALDLRRYTERTFDMFGGEEHHVTMEFRSYLADVVLDRFGRDVMIIATDEDWFRISVNVVVSQRFFAWLFSFGADCRLVAPAAVRQHFLDRLQEVGHAYAHTQQ